MNHLASCGPLKEHSTVSAPSSGGVARTFISVMNVADKFSS